MQGLNNLIKMGKVLYLGVSDTPAWVISKANQYARDHGLAPFVSLGSQLCLIAGPIPRTMVCCRA